MSAEMAKIIARTSTGRMLIGEERRERMLEVGVGRGIV